MDNQWEHEAVQAALRIIPVLQGMPLNQARYALKEAETLLLQTHSVDADNAALKTFAREYDLSRSK